MVGDVMGQDLSIHLIRLTFLALLMQNLSQKKIKLRRYIDGTQISPALFQPEFLGLDQPTPSELKERESLKSHYKNQLRISSMGGVGNEKIPSARVNIGSNRTSPLLPQVPDAMQGWPLPHDHSSSLGPFPKQNYKSVEIGRHLWCLSCPRIQTGLSRAGCLGPCPGGFPILPRREVPQPLQTICSTAQSLSQ